MTQMSDNVSYSKEIAKGTVWSIAGNMFFKLLSFFYLIVLARMATQDEVGLFYLALSIVSLLVLFADLGLSQCFARYLPYFKARKEYEKIRKMLKSSYLIAGSLSILLLIIVYLQADFIAQLYENPDLGTAIKLFSPYFVIIVFFKLNQVFLQGQKDIRGVAFVDNIQNASKLILAVLLFVLIGADIFTIILSFLLSFAIAVVFSFLPVYSTVKNLPQNPKEPSVGYSSLLSDLVPFGIMVTAVSSLWKTINFLDKMMIGYMLPSDIATAQVAIYSIATALAMLLMMFPGAIGSIFFPLVSQLVGERKMDNVCNICATSSRWLLFITVPLALVLIVFSKKILSLFYGPEYVPGALTMSIFTFGLFLRSLSIMPAFVLAGLRLVKIELKIAAVAAVTNILLNIAMIPIWGIEGATLASAISLLFASMLFFYYGKQQFGFKLDNGIYKLMFAALISFVIVFFAEPYLSDLIPLLPETGIEYADKAIRLSILAALFAISVSVFMIISFILKSFTNDDISLMSSSLRRAKIPEPIIKFMEKFVSYGVS